MGLTTVQRYCAACDYYDLDTLAENAHYHLFRHSCRQAHCLNHLYTVKPRPPGAWDIHGYNHPMGEGETPGNFYGEFL